MDPRECVLLSNHISFGSPDNILCEVIRFPRDNMTEHSGITSVNLICEFEANPQHYYNVMGRVGIFSEQDLHSHIDRIRSHGEWGTNTEDIDHWYTVIGFICRSVTLL